MKVTNFFFCPFKYFSPKFTFDCLPHQRYIHQDPNNLVFFIASSLLISLGYNQIKFYV